MIGSLPAIAADQVAPPPLLPVELAGCRRVIGGTPPAVPGHLPADAASALAALADRPAT